MDYEIRVEGGLDAAWSDWFEGMALSIQRQGRYPTMTSLSGPISDQAALRGILNKLWDLNLTLVSVRRCSDDRGGL